MPIIKSAKKRVKTNNKKEKLNSKIKSTMKTAIKKFKKADKKDKNELLKNAINKINKAKNKKIIKKNTASRYISRITKNNNNETKYCKALCFYFKNSYIKIIFMIN